LPFNGENFLKSLNFVGSVTSPLLANIYLHEMDKYMESNYLNISKLERNKRRKAGKGNYLYTRYADDCAPRRREGVPMT
jgi:retron-type reverse transcriptase